MTVLAVLLAVEALAQVVRSPPVVTRDSVTLLAEADALYARRAEGARGATADPAVIDQASALYRRALQAAPDDADVLSKLLRALHFRGAFCGAGVEARKAVFEEGKSLGQLFVERVERSLDGRKRAERIAAIRAVPHAVDVYFWTAACWGQWALARGKLAAARQGVAGKVRDLAQTVIDVDPELEEGGGYRMLGRLHDEAPKILFFTGWVSKDKALAYLRQSYKIAPQNSVTRFFLAEAILDHDEKHADEARRLLRSCVDGPPRPEYLVEDRYYAEQAQARLSRLK